ncbi:hypothetical protein LA080_005881 [Diaporthe eres]|nr:hypothetical protein LA080_005881 [Diaporthe eres]
MLTTAALRLALLLFLYSHSLYEIQLYQYQAIKPHGSHAADWLECLLTHVGTGQRDSRGLPNAFGRSQRARFASHDVRESPGRISSWSQTVFDLLRSKQKQHESIVGSLEHFEQGDSSFEISQVQLRNSRLYIKASSLEEERFYLAYSNHPGNLFPSEPVHEPNACHLFSGFKEKSARLVEFLIHG